MAHPSSVRSIAALAAVCGGLLGCESGVTGGGHLEPGTAALLEVTGHSPEVTILNSGPAELHVTIAAGEIAPNIVIIPAGVTRWWFPAHGEHFRFENRGVKPLDLSYRVRHAGVKYIQPAPR